MINVLFRLFTTTLLFFMLFGCSGGSNPSDDPTQYGTITITPSAINVPNGSTATAIINLSNSVGVGNITVGVVSADTSVATLDVAQCILSTNNPTCSVVISGASIGSTQINLNTSYNGHNYSITSAMVTVSNSINFTTVVQGLSNTIYSNTVYPTSFIFTNTDSVATSLGASTISMPNPIIWVESGDTCSNRTIESGATCTISGNVSLASASTGNTISISLNRANGVATYLYQTDEYAVAFKSGYAALRVYAPAESDGHTGVYFFVDIGGVTSDTGAHPVQYTLSNNNIYTGNVIVNSANGLAPSSYTFELPAGNTTIYTPPMLVGASLQNAGARMFLSYGGALSGVAGAQPNTQQNIPYVMPEYNVPANLQTVLDVSYVNSISVPVAATGTEQLSGSVKWTNSHAGVKSQYYNYSGTTLMNGVKLAMSIYPGAWDISSYFQQVNNQLIAILAPVTVFTDSSVVPSGFNTTLFNTYFNDVWMYYSNGHNFMINAIEVSNQMSSTNCILSGSISGGNMNFSPTVGSVCPTGSYVSGGTTFNTGASTFSIPESQLNYYNFFGAFANQSVFGVNGTYQSLVKYMAGAWAVGFLPFCGHDNIQYTKGVLESYAANLFTPQYTCLTNYSTYGASTLDQYDKQVHKYFDSYGYGYDDTVGIDSTITTDGTQFPMTVYALKFNN